MLRTLDLSPREAAKKFGFSWRWFRRVSTQGIGKIDKRSHDRLQQIADEFHIKVEELWDRRLPEKLALKGPSTERLASAKQHRYWKHAEKLLELLESGDHAYLADQIDKLYALHWAEKKGGADRRPYNEPEPADEEDVNAHRRSANESGGRAVHININVAGFRLAGSPRCRGDDLFGIRTDAAARRRSS